MSYQNLPDPRPIGVRLALGPLPRWAALSVTTVLYGLALAGAAAAVVRLMKGGPDSVTAACGVVAVLGLLAAVHYTLAIRWADLQKMWPRRRSHRRHRVSR
ncbi:MAG TPA: hypothetical protein VGF55_21835 [Gemmataceae bacterium]|jgi:hypothetical protein